MPRSSWKPKYISNCLLKAKILDQEEIYVWSRSSTIPESLDGKVVFVHTGKEFKKVFINRSRFGFKFGEFAPSRKFNMKKDKKNLKNLKKKK